MTLSPRRGGDAAPARAAPARVAEAQGQARRTLLVAATFTLAAPLSVVVPHDTGAWLPLHLFLVGGLLSAISGATQLLAVTWSASPAPPARWVGAQRWAVAAGAVLVAVGREVDSDALLGLGGLTVVGSLVVLAVILVRIHRTAVVPRFRPAIEAYVVAVALGTAGSLLGALIGVDPDPGAFAARRGAHLTLNLLGLVGLVVAGTLPYFLATQARARMAGRVTAPRLRVWLAALAVASAVGAAGRLGDRPALAAVAYVAYAAAFLVGVVAWAPSARSHQLRWAGPRLAHLAAGIVWWSGGVALVGLRPSVDPFGEAALLQATVVGGLAQILVASLAYFGPVLRGGGHRRLSQGFATTRSWLGLVAANAAAVALLVGAGTVGTALVLVWVVDTAVRAGALLRASAPREGPGLDGAAAPTDPTAG